MAGEVGEIPMRVPALAVLTVLHAGMIALIPLTEVAMWVGKTPPVWAMRRSEPSARPWKTRSMRCAHWRPKPMAKL